MKALSKLHYILPNVMISRYKAVHNPKRTIEATTNGKQNSWCKFLYSATLRFCAIIAYCGHHMETLWVTTYYKSTEKIRCSNRDSLNYVTWNSFSKHCNKLADTLTVWRFEVHYHVLLPLPNHSAMSSSSPDAGYSVVP